MSEQPLDLALVGNCRTAFLADRSGRIVWWCFPRFDGDAVFCRLLSGDEEIGFTDVVLDGLVEREAAYRRNTAILDTTLRDGDGNAVQITDFAPRFKQHGRIFRPLQIVRRITPIAGLPRIALRLRPRFGYGRAPERFSLGSNHIRYRGGDCAMRVTSDAPIAFLDAETTFPLTRPLNLVIGPDESFEADIARTCREFEEETEAYWQEWVRYLAVPYDWQEDVIRAAITLKLCQFEETGAIVAAHTTSIPEAAATPRTWDYRFCWLRDAYFVVEALNKLGATRTMEDYLGYIQTVATGQAGPLEPLYATVPGAPREEWIVPHLQGFRGNGPVRVGNQAASQVQHDVYGSVILAFQQMFVDKRLPKPGDETLFRRLEPLGAMAARVAFEPDSGIWEYRGRKRVHTHSVALCWTACDRLARIAVTLDIAVEARAWRERADAIRSRLLTEAWSEERRAYTAALGHPDLDASVLLFLHLGLLSPNDERFRATLAAIERELVRDGHILRYAAADDFGLPETAFLACRFWWIDALAAVGRRDEALELFGETLRARNHFGLLSEDIDPRTGRLWGNIPQTYSMAGIVISAMRLSRSWEEAAWRGS